MSNIDMFWIVTGMFCLGGTVVWLLVLPELTRLRDEAERLRKLTDRDERGRFVRREP